MGERRAAGDGQEVSGEGESEVEALERGVDGEMPTNGNDERGKSRDWIRLID